MGTYNWVYKHLYLFITHLMELPSKLSEQVAFNTRPKIEEHMLIVMEKSTHKEHFS